MGQSNHRSLKAENFLRWKQRDNRGGQAGAASVKEISSMIRTDALLLALGWDPHARSRTRPREAHRKQEKKWGQPSWGKDGYLVDSQQGNRTSVLGQQGTEFSQQQG